jgi:hypothetical protein
MRGDSSSLTRDPRTQEFYNLQLEAGLEALGMTKVSFLHPVLNEDNDSKREQRP